MTTSPNLRTRDEARDSLADALTNIGRAFRADPEHPEYTAVWMDLDGDFFAWHGNGAEFGLAGLPESWRPAAVAAAPVTGFGDALEDPAELADPAQASALADVTVDGWVRLRDERLAAGRCRRCGADVPVTVDADGRVEQTDGSGLAVCDACWDRQQQAEADARATRPAPLT